MTIEIEIDEKIHLSANPVEYCFILFQYQITINHTSGISEDTRSLSSESEADTTSN